MALFDVDYEPSFNTTSRHGLYATDGCYDHRPSLDGSVESSLYTPSVTSRSPSISAMDRFLHETDGPFFTSMNSHTFNDNPIDHFAALNGRVSPDRLRFPSPAYSGLGSASISSSWGDRRDTPPFTSPELPRISYSHMQPVFDHGVSFAYGGHPPPERHDSHSGGCCVAMHDVQKTADEQPESYAYDNEPATYMSYGSYTQEGYQPMYSGDDSTSNASHSAASSDYYPSVPSQRLEVVSPVIRRRRAQSSHTGRSPGRIVKRPQAARRSSSYQQPAEDSSAPHVASASRAFPCPLAIYGCSSSFGSKNEWKRHVNTQHLRLGFWRCDLCAGANGDRKPNDFNRKDLFTQHVRRMHPSAVSRGGTKKCIAKPTKDLADDQYLQDAAARCYHSLRMPPGRSCCLFCDKTFNGQGSWDERMEHVGRHMESAKKDTEKTVEPHEWRIDELTQQWLLNEHILIVEDERLVLVQ